jgi:DNA replication and repair protein RecF
MTHAPHAITLLTLENFRNYRTLSLTLEPRPVVLRGVNGAGKTNILEAISLLAPGRGFRGAKLRDMDRIVTSHQSPVASEERKNLESGDRRPETAHWVVAAEIKTRGETLRVGTGRDPDSNIEKRITKIDGQKVRGAVALVEHVSIQWLTPAMDQVFMEGGTARRKFLDRIVYGFSPEHAARVSAYELAMRERTRILVDRQMTDPYWLSVLEQQMAEHAVAITLARLEVVGRLQETLKEELTHFPRALIALEGTLESWLAEGNSALEVEAKFAERLMILRGSDAARGRASEGPHRSQLIVIHREKDAPAERCSTGEQKALLLSIILAAARARAAWCGLAPILLLDEVIAHLDVDKRASLFDLIRTLQVQAWMTGTDAADFQGLDGVATVLEIDGGTAKIC